MKLLILLAFIAFMAACADNQNSATKDDLVNSGRHTEERIFEKLEAQQDARRSGPGARITHEIGLGAAATETQRPDYTVVSNRIHAGYNKQYFVVSYVMVSKSQPKNIDVKGKEMDMRKLYFPVATLGEAIQLMSYMDDADYSVTCGQFEADECLQIKAIVRTSPPAVDAAAN